MKNVPQYSTPLMKRASDSADHQPVPTNSVPRTGPQRQALQNWLTRLVNAMHGRIYGFNESGLVGAECAVTYDISSRLRRP